MNRSLTRLSRWTSIVSAIALTFTLFLPLWKIELDAPQYPEGLVLSIHPHGLGGDVDVINGLNHYIGMRTLHAEDFVEFAILPWIIGTLALFGLLSALVNRKWFFTVWGVLFIVFGIIAMIDFYRWEYNYGHNLDDTAPIKVPGMTYQPPLIGYGKLLNFGAWSVPDIGGWIFLCVGLMLAICLFLELRGMIRITSSLEIRTEAAALAGILLFLSSCRGSGPVPIRYGQDACDFCRMTISDRRFAAELLTDRGRIYKFDDIKCLESFRKSGSVDSNRIAGAYLPDFSRPGPLLPAEQMHLLRCPIFRGPMGGNMVAFERRDSLLRWVRSHAADTVDREEIHGSRWMRN